MVGRIFALQAYTQSYDWGKLGSASKAAAYARVATPGFEVDEGKPYAELWMGTHPTLPSTLTLRQTTTLGAYLRVHPELLGTRGLADLPFLFKVLAIRKALSIQTHPDKPFAERLHAAAPHVYKDANHKPEMAIALTPFRAMCGFRTLDEIRAFVLAISPARFAVGGEDGDGDGDDVVRTFIDDPSGATFARLFARILRAADADSVAGLVRALREGALDRLAHIGAEGRAAGELALTLNAQFPGDVGVFCAFFLQMVELAPGDAIFLGAGEPHAYISGDIVEVMATSDNVLRAGLTPKHRDVDNLLASLTWTFGVKHAVTPTSLSTATTTTSAGKTTTTTRYSKVYDPPVPEFSVVQVALPAREREVHRPFDGPSIVIVTEGAGTLAVAAPGEEDEDKDGEVALQEGSVVFIGAGVDVAFATSGDADRLVLYRAYYP